jgi:hypothetical protein
MAQMRRLSALGLAAIILTLSLTVVSEGQGFVFGGKKPGRGPQPAAPALSDQALAIQNKLLSQIKLTKATADNTDVVTAGDIVVLNKDGLMMCNSASTYAYSNTYDSGVLTAIQPTVGNPNAAAQAAVSSAVTGAVFSHFLGSFGGGLANSALSAAQAAQAAQAQAAQAKNACTPRKFVAGEKFWVTGIVAQTDGILISTLSDPYSDVRYYGEIKFNFPDCAGSPAPARMKMKKLVDDDDSLFEAPAGAFAYGGRDRISTPCLAPPVDDFLKTVAELISVVPPEDTSNQGSPAEQAGDQGGQPAATPAAPVPAAPAPLTDIAPPPPPADTPPPTIALGQTKDEVTAAFGQPGRIVKLGVKEIFVYKDMKVTFTNGKVSNVE